MFVAPVRFLVHQQRTYVKNRGATVEDEQDGGDLPGTAGGRGTPLDFPTSAGGGPDEQRGGAGAATCGDLAQAQWRDRERLGESVRRADAVGGSDLPPAGSKRIGVPHRLPRGPPARPPRSLVATRKGRWKLCCLISGRGRLPCDNGRHHETAFFVATRGPHSPREPYAFRRLPEGRRPGRQGAIV